MAADPAVLIELAELAFAYPGRQPVMEEVSFVLRRGEKVGIAGLNGCGKTTLLHLIVGLLAPAAGRIVLFGREMERREDFAPLRGRIGLLFQDADDQLFCPTVIEDVAFGPLNQGKTTAAARDIAMDTLRRLEIAGLAGRATHQLSGGEKKLVALAGVLAMQPEVLLLDEPTGGLDARTKERILLLLKETEQACIIISHEYDFLVELAGTISLLQDGRIHLDAAEAAHSHLHVHRFGKYPHAHHS